MSERDANSSGRVVLVTSGAGYIGSHACKALARVDYLPVTYDNLAYGHEWAVKYGPLERGDILERSRLDEVIAKHRPIFARESTRARPERRQQINSIDERSFA